MSLDNDAIWPIDWGFVDTVVGYLMPLTTHTFILITTILAIKLDSAAICL